MIKKNALVSVLLLLFFTPAWATVAVAPWPMLQHDIFHQGFSTDYGPNLDHAALNFSCDVGAEVTATPVVDTDGAAYIGSKDGCLYKVRTDGTQECIYPDIEGPVTASAALADDGTLYVCSTAGKLYAITTDGTLKWVFTTTPQEPIFSSPAIGPGGMIFFGTGPLQKDAPGALYCITPEGNKLWSYATGAVGSSSPAVDRYGNIYIGTYSGTVHAVSGSGTPLWSYTDKDTISSPMLAQDGTVYITNLWALIALNFDLSFKWEFTPTSKVLGMDIESGILGSPALDQKGNVIVAGGLGDMHYVGADGQEIWSQLIKKLGVIPAIIRSSPIIDKNGTIYVRSQNFIYALDPVQGSITSKIRLEFNPLDIDTAFDGSPVLGTRRMLYMCSSDGKLYAVGPDKLRGSIAGTITGDTAAAGMKVLVYKDPGIIPDPAPEMYEAPVEADGSYIVQDIYPGSYMVTPICQNPFIAVEPAFKKISFLAGQHKTGIDFTIPPPDTTGQNPYISMAEASPNPLLRPEQGSLHIEARVLASTPVTWDIDLSELGSLPDNVSVQKPDPSQAACSWDIDVTGSDILGPRVLMVSATSNGKVARRPVLVDFQHHNAQEIDNGTSADFSEIIPEQPFAGSLFKILFKYSLPAGPSPNPPAGSAKESASSGLGELLLQIFRPSNTTGTPDYTVPITSQQQEVQINNAESGAWGLTVTSTTDINVQCDLTSTIAGTGIIFGTVIDSESRAPVNGANIRASSGTSATTQDGGYVLLSPSGVFNLTASPPHYLPTTKSVSLNAGSTVEKNISLIASNFSDNQTNCLATAVLGHATGKLDILRQFRDICMKKTPLGRAYSKKYYRFSPEITALMAADPALRLQALETLEAVLPLIQARVGGNVVEPQADPDERIRACLKAFRSAASPQLAREIDMGLNLLAARRFFDLTGLVR